MLEQLKRLGGDSLLYALMNVGTKLIAFLMLPIYTLYLSPTQMGVFENIDAITSILIFVVIFGTDNALAYYFFKTEEEDFRVKYVQNVLSFRLLIALIFFLLFVLLGEMLATTLLDNGDYKYLFYISGSVLVFDSIVTLILTYYRFQFKSKKVVLLTVGRLAGVALLSFVFLKYFHLELQSIFLSRLISALVVLLFLLFPLFQFLRFKFDKEILKQLLIYGAPLVPASIAFWIITSSNRFFLTHFESLESVGIYGVAIKFATIISLLTSSVQMAWRPYSMSLQKNKDAKKIYANIFDIILVVGILGLLGIGTVIPYILEFMIPDVRYKEASLYISLLSLGSFLSFYYLIISVGLFLEKKTSTISLYVGIAAIVSIILNIILIPLFSLWGAVASLLIAYLLVNIMIFIKSQQVYYIKVNVIRLFINFIIGLISILLILYIHEFSDLSKLYLLGPWILYLLIVYITGIWKSFHLKKRGE